MQFNKNRRLALASQALAAIVLVAASLPAQAQNWPDRPIKLVVPYPAGGNADNTARLLATQLSARLGQQVVVDNRPGGGGTIGAAAVAKAAPDGYTLLLDATAFTVNPSLFARLPFDAATRAIVAGPEMRQRFAEMGVQGVGSSAQEFKSFVQSETAKWAGVIRASGIRMD
ncbi:tripartite tricarboxylate transporter substrate-binding protein [Alicycliphilus sp. T452]